MSQQQRVSVNCRLGRAERVAVWLAVVVSGCGSVRRLPTHEQLLLDARAHHEEVLEQHERLVGTMSERLLRERAASDGAPTFDVLMLSGGGQYGAFGAGVLRGWGRVADPEFALPSFDVVTGVSTGSLIAPFAFAGSVEEIERVERFYREVRKDLAVLRGVLFFLPWREAFFDITGLEQTLDEEIGPEELAALRTGHAEHRSLLVASTDIDLGVMRVWDLGHEVQGLDDAQALGRVRRLLRASASIPAAFPPIEIDGHLHVDGGVAENLFLPSDVVEAVLLAPRPEGEPLPRVRLWVIVNGKLSPGIEPTRIRWPAVAARSSHTATHMAMAIEMRRIQDFVQWIACASGAEVEYRYLALPEDFEIPPSSALFEATLMGRMADLGEELGADPASWRTDPPRPEDMTSELVPQEE